MTTRVSWSKGIDVKSSVIRNTLEWIVVIILVVGLAMLVRYFAVEPRQVRMSSMHPTLEDGDYVLVNRMAYITDGPERGDVVVFEPPYSGKDDYIKRVVGLPGETVKNIGGEIWIDELKLSDDFRLLSSSDTENINQNLRPGDSTKGEEVGENEYYVVGDNRGHSMDSRSFGPVKRDHIKGQAFMIFFPLNRFQFIP